MARKKQKLDEVLSQGKEMIQFYRQNPCIASYDLLGVDLAAIQRLVFRDMWFKNYVITIAGRGFGKTYLLGLLASLSALLYPGNRVGLIGPVFRQSLDFTINNGNTFWTNSGLKYSSQELYDSIVPNLTMTQSLYSQNTVLSKWKNNDRACRYIKTTKGFELSGTTDHAVMVLGKDRFNNIIDINYKDLQDIKTEYIAIRHGFNYFGNNNSIPKFDEFEHDWRTKDCVIPHELTTDLAYWMGLLVGDGCVSVSKNKRKQRVDFVNEEQDLLDSFERYLREYFLVNKKEKIDRRNRKNDTWEIQYFCKKLVQYLLKCDFTKTTALDKKIPDVIKNASREVFIAFLHGLFDTDGGVYIQHHKSHGGTHCEVFFSTSSLQLAKEIHSVLLNLGIISNLGISTKACVKQLPQGNKPSKCAEAYKIRITGQEFLTRFANIIGFRSERKNKLLTDYLSSHFNRENSLARLIGLPKNIVDKNYSKCKEFANQGLYFVKMVDSDYFFAPTIDIEVENESCYWANGFINHNSKMIFSEVEKLYEQSSILKEACIKKPTRGSDICYLKFKSVGGRTPSYIEALPLGVDGGKIRGSRFYLILVDELAQVPDQTLDLVLRPMGATALAPMERVRRVEKQTRLIEAGIAVASDFQEEKVNKMVMTSSGYYKFNHMWRRMRDHWDMMNKAEEEKKECDYSVWQIPHWDLPEGFLDKNNIAEAKRIMSHSEFRMEYEAEMISDSEGFFKASLLESCTINSGHTIELRGKKGESYIMGVDPNQGGKTASTGIVIVRVGPVNRLVNVIELKRNTTQQLTKAVQSLCDSFNIIRIFMDKGGGGKAICDLLEDGFGGYDPLIDITNDDHRFMDGRHILEPVNFNPAWISDANFTTKSLLEDKTLLFPEPPVKEATLLDLMAKNYENVNNLKSQMFSIIVTQTATGILHFDTPVRGQRKDLYSAIILAAHGARLIEKELEGEEEAILYNSGGMMRLHNQSSMDFQPLGAASGNRLSVVGLSAAVLEKKRK